MTQNTVALPNTLPARSSRGEGVPALLAGCARAVRSAIYHRRRIVAAGILPAVEGGFQPPGSGCQHSAGAGCFAGGIRRAGSHGSTAAKMAAATGSAVPDRRETTLPKGELRNSSGGAQGSYGEASGISAEPKKSNGAARKTYGEAGRSYEVMAKSYGEVEIF